MKIKGIEAVTSHGVKVECELEDVGDGKHKIMAVYAQGEHSDDAWLYLIGSVVRLKETNMGQVVALINDVVAITDVERN